jgi:hypothetical protein
MGVEYKIAFAPVADTVDDILRSATYFTQTIEFDHRLTYEYRLPDNTGAMPNAHASIESYGVYFCDFGGARDIMADIVQQIMDQIGSPDVSELE